ncbi:MAG: cupin domain-containing protein [Burkholderiales bacterium]|nr:cupin domain-containing protein [Burkholderiales bacterium]
MSSAPSQPPVPPELPVLDDADCARLLAAIPARTPPAGLRARVLGQTAARAAITTVPASAAGWAELLPRVFAKRLHSDGTAESWLVRLLPGARAPAHDHPGAEECLVLEGAIRYEGGSRLAAGDFEAVAAGGHHPELVSDEGALVFLRYALPLDRYIRL